MQTGAVWRMQGVGRDVRHCELTEWTQWTDDHGARGAEEMTMARAERKRLVSCQLGDE